MDHPGGVQRRPEPAPLRPSSDGVWPEPHLPASLTSFIGRENEIAAIGELLGNSTVRLLTLTGPGGVGKTRLALKVAEAAASGYDGVAFIPLAAVDHPDFVGVSVAGTLAVSDADTRDPARSVGQYLHGRRFLLVLDNFEHLLPAAVLATDWLSACPSLTILATSRAVLGVTGEHTVAVDPLPVPDPGRMAPAGLLAEMPSIRLFVERARAVRAGFALTQNNAAAVAAICARLDGLPLAIELAAARVQHLPPPALLDRLERRLPTLIGGPRDQPIRLRTMRDAIAWSYDLLEAEEQVLFRLLSVFVGSCTLEAAETVVSRAVYPDVDVFGGIASLVSTSLLRLEADPGGEPRYRMLETVREFAVEHLEASGEAAAIRRAHTDYFADAADRVSSGFAAPSPRLLLRRFEADLGNFRDALARALSGDDVDVETALRMVGALIPAWTTLGYTGEGRRWLAEALAREDGVEPTVRAKALLGMSPERVYAFGVPALATELVEEARQSFRVAGDDESEIDATVWLATLALFKNDLDRARVLYDDALASCRRLSDPVREAWVLCMLGTLHNLGTPDQPTPHEDSDRAEAYCQEALAIFRERGDRSGIARALNGLAFVANKRGDFSRALPLLHETLTLRIDLDDRTLAVPCLHDVAAVAGAQGQAERAARLYGAAAALSTTYGLQLVGDTFRAKHDREVSVARRALGDETFADFWAAGRSLSLEQAVAEAMAVTLVSVDARPSPPSTGLTTRETEVLRLLAEGQSDREIAEALSLSYRTVTSYVTSILGKLGFDSRTAAATYAVRHGLA